MPQLVSPNLAVAPSVRAAARDYGDDPLPAYSSEVAALADGDLARYVERLRADALEETPRPAAHVPSTHLWWIEGSTFIGRVHIRHRLTPFLHEVGGHIGYHVISPYRRRGHATAMLAAAIPVVASMGMDRLLITCHADNVGSRKVIESSGGTFEDRRGNKLRYWIELGR
jgi:predicted acetyltransferase